MHLHSDGRGISIISIRIILSNHWMTTLPSEPQRQEKEKSKVRCVWISKNYKKKVDFQLGVGHDSKRPFWLELQVMHRQNFMHVSKSSLTAVFRWCQHHFAIPAAATTKIQKVPPTDVFCARFQTLISLQAQTRKGKTCLLTLRFGKGHW